MRLNKLNFLFVLLFGVITNLWSQQFSFPESNGGFNTPKKEQPNPSKWTYEVVENEVELGGEITLKIIATIEENWYVTGLGPYDLANPTEINFIPNPSYKLSGKAKAIGFKSKDDEYLGKYDYKEHTAVFEQKIKVLNETPSIDLTVTYSSCNLTTGVCLPPLDADLHIVPNLTITQSKTTISVSKTILNENNFESEQLVTSNYEGLITKLNKIESCTCDSAKKSVTAENKHKNNKLALINTNCEIEDKTIINHEGKALTKYSSAGEITVNKSSSLIWTFLLAFGFGLIALLTPCVFPMIPMTVSFFTKGSSGSKKGLAIFYGFSIIIIYTLIGLFVSLVFGAEVMNEVATSNWANIIFFIVFIFFALAFLGMYELNLPNQFVNQVDAQSDKGGLIGAFFMALTLVLVSFSCTGPIVGTILVQASQGEFLEPTIGMLGFSLAFALPFTIFALIPGLMSGLPQSGGWLNSVKVVLGFIELALAFKFLSVADLAYHWNLLDRDIFIIIWIAIFGGLTIYLFGKLQLPHDSPLEKLSVPRLMLSLVSLGFVIYLIPGLFGAPLKGLSGILPPESNHDFNLFEIVNNQHLSKNESSQNHQAKYSDFLHLPHGINGYFDYEEGVCAAKKLNKPIFIDFTGHGCVNCRRMEANVWSDPKILDKLKNEFVVIALYVDDRTELSKEEQYTSAYDGKLKATIGKKNADIEVQKIGAITQPNYVILNHEGQLLSGPHSYNTDIEAFDQFLKKGVEQFKAQK